MSLYQLVYYSENAMEGDKRAQLQNLRDILEVSQKNNQKKNVTGGLIFDQKWFLQILEGELEDVMETYNRIAHDDRHKNATVIKKEPINERRFNDWSMGGMMRTPEMQEVFLQHGISGEIDPTRLSGNDVVELAADLQTYMQGQT